MDTIILDSNLSKALAHGGRDEFDAFDDGRDNVCDGRDGAGIGERHV